MILPITEKHIYRDLMINNCNFATRACLLHEPVSCNIPPNPKHFISINELAQTIHLKILM